MCANRQTARPQCESLESRQMCAAWAPDWSTVGGYAARLGGKTVVGIIAGEITKRAYTANGDTCAPKPVWAPVPAWLWNSFACYKTAE